MTGPEPFDYGPLLSYEVTWTSGHVETIRAHQCILPPSGFFTQSVPGEPRRVMFHGEIDGRWQLVLAADEADIRTVRNVTAGEVLS